MNTELLTRVQQINPATSDDSIPAGIWGAQQVLKELQHRTDTFVPLRPRPNRPWLIAAAVAVVVLIMIGGLGVLTRDRSTDAPPVINQPEPTPTTVPESSPTTLPEPTSPTTTVLPETVNRDVEDSWREVDWGLRSGHFPVWGLASSGVLLREDRDGRLLSSGDGETWEPVFADLTDVSIAVDGPVAVAAGTRNDGSSALLVSDDGETWSEVDHSALTGSGRLEVVDTTRSGLTWFLTGGIVEDGDGVLAMIASDQLIDLHVPPWGSERCCTLIDLVETTRGIVAFQDQWNPPEFSYAWSYQGSGQWSQPVEIPKSSEHVRVGDTILMIDQTNATCCANPILGESLWPVLASNDGINWTEVSSLAGSTSYPPVSGGSDGVHNLHLVAGESFWVYGPQIGGGGGGIEYDASTTLWISTDGTNWQPIDVDFDPPTPNDRGRGFVRAAGDFIFVHYYDGPDQTATIRWVGEVKPR